ncbi:plasmid fertility inhibition factor family protein [Trinickia dinghuensis]|uniref:Uncharacterized protein n=1 Tax=Trinickia dinghuensis TaxID=2291023 RepID=A0A3D8JUA6_9BURK|nr:hypothetical protein [Trinickia dinghuensis]RDU95971.1 hypothetical protein DWV00_25250 [Trinickia dinghuensis]
MSTSASIHAVALAPSAGPGSIWLVPLPLHSHYDHVRLKRVFEDDQSRHRVVVVDARKLLECADRDDTDYVLPPVGNWHSGKVKGIRDFLDPENERIPAMPYVTVDTRRARGLLGWFGFHREGVVAFRNGQHRARYLAHMGAVAFPVEVHEREADRLTSLCGYVAPPAPIVDGASARPPESPASVA